MNFFTNKFRMGVLALIAAAGLGIAPAEAVELKMLTSWGPNYVGTKEMAYRFIANLTAASGGDININPLGPETVPPFEQLQPVTAGAFDMLFTHGAYHFGDTGVGMSMDAVTGTPAQLRESGLWKMVDESYGANGLKLVALPVMSSGYHLILRQPVGESGDLAGLKIRATPVYHGLLEKLGASAVVLPGGEIYSALERGIVDGAAWPAIGALDFRWNEVAGYFLRPTFGSVNHLILMNLDKWNSLSPSEQELISSQGQILEEEVYAFFQAKLVEEVAALKAAGMSETSLSDENIAQLSKLWSDGVWAVAAGKGEATISALRETATAANLTE